MKKLITFNIGEQAHERFKDACYYRRETMTTALLGLIKGYVLETEIERRLRDLGDDAKGDLYA